MFFILGGCLDTPICKYAPVCLYTPYICTPSQGCTHPHMFPILFCASMFSEASACFGGCKGPPYMLDTSLHLPCMWVSPLQLHLLLSCWLPCALGCFRDIGMSYWDFSPSVGVWGVFSIYWGCWGHQHMGCPYAHSCIFL